LQIFKEVQAQWGSRAGEPDEGADIETAPDDDSAVKLNLIEVDEYLNHNEVQKSIAEALFRMSPKGFEEFRARILRSTGFENVTTTGGSGDGGIDGIGDLLIGRFVRTRVAFQCKKYQETTSIAPEKIRDFRGAISGRVERGIFMTTSRFSRAAIEEARRVNTIPIELVDLERLISIIIEEKIGVHERRALEFDRNFFDQYCR